MIHFKLPKSKFLLYALFLIIFISVNTYSALKSSNQFFKNSVTDSIINNSEKHIEGQVYTFVEQMPQFPGGQKSMFTFINQNIHYPEEAYKNKTEGKVVVQFIVSETGKITNATVVRSASPDLDQEALRLINSFPAWEPGKQNGKPVPVYFTLPITFKYTHVRDVKNSNIINDSTNWKITDSTLVIIDNIKLPLGFNLDVINPEEIDTGFALKPFPVEKKIKLINQYGPLAKNGVLLLETYKIEKLYNDTTTYKAGNDKFIYKTADKMPQYRGGESMLMSYIGKNLRYPILAQESGIQGKVVVRFVVDRTGKVKFPRVIKKIHPLLDNEALRIIRSLSTFIPAEKGGQKVSVYLTLPLTFKIEDAGKSKINNFNYNFNYIDLKNLLILLDGDKLPIGFDINWLNFVKFIDYRVLTPMNEKEKQQYIEKYGLEGINGIVEIKSAKSIQKTNNPDQLKDSMGNHIYHVIEVMPEFPGGSEKLLKFIEKKLKYPETSQANHVHGRVILCFVVNSNGNIEKAEVIRSLDSECDKEALRVINLLPTWIPGRQNGVNVSVWYTIPINFSM